MHLDLYCIRSSRTSLFQATCLPSLVGETLHGISHRWIPNIYKNRDIATASIGPRSIVAASPDEIQASKWELEADTERFIQAAEVSSRRGNIFLASLTFPITGVNLPLCMDNLQRSHTTTKLPIWRNGESSILVRHTDNHLRCKLISTHFFRDGISFVKRKRALLAILSF